MGPIEIIIIVLLIAFFAFLIGRYIYRKKNNLPTGECSCCSHSKKGNELVKKYRKKYKSKH